jgi:hypothetical protein
MFNQLKGTHKGESNWITFPIIFLIMAILMVTKSKNGVALLDQLQQFWAMDGLLDHFSLQKHQKKKPPSNPPHKLAMPELNYFPEVAEHCNCYP